MEKNIENNEKIIYDELISLTENITNYFAGQLQDYFGLINYMEQLSLEFKTFSSKIKLPKGYLENKSKDNLAINCFYDFHCFLCSDFKIISEKIKSEILSPLQNFKAEFESDNKLIFFSLNSIIEEINSKKTSKSKESHDVFISNLELNFDKVKATFEESEIKKANFIYNCLNAFYKLVHDDWHFTGPHEDDMKNLLKKYKSKTEKRAMIDIFPSSKILKWKDWTKNKNELDDWEELSVLDISKTNNNNNDKNNIMSTTISEFYIPQIVIKNNIIGIDDEFMVFNPQENQAQNEISFVDIMENEEKIKDNIIINNFLYGLDIQSPKNDILLSIEDVFGRNLGNKYFILEFCDKLIKARGAQKTLYEIKIFSNLVFLTNVMNLILENIKNDLLSDKISDDILNSFKILDVIICIGEKSVSGDTYMCSLLCKNKIFKDKKIWINSIKNKIIILLNELCIKEYKSKAQESVFRLGDNNFLHLNKRQNKLKNFFGEIGGLIFEKKKNLIESCGFNKLIKYYDKLSSEQKKNLDNNALSIFHAIIKCYIRHITNYNFSVKNETDIISEICSKLNITDNSHIIFYCYYYQDCLLTTKKINSKNFSHFSQKIKDKINYIKLEEKIKNIPKKYEIDINSDSKKYFIIKNASKYLDNKDKFKLIGLGKYYMKIKKNIYKQLLRNNISQEKRLIIWKSYLKFKSTSALYNYKEILEETKTELFQKNNEKSISQINKDINRTYFRTKDENLPNILYNILISFVYSENKINYVQGINTITAFIYDLTKNEEETFHFLLCLFNFTQLRDIYDDDEFNRLKILFYSMERILYLFLPKIYSKLKDQNLQISVFMSAYFITLFTILYPHLSENDSIFICHIWDEFIFDGWKSFFVTWLAILKYYENDIINCNEGDIMNLLINKTKDCELFKKENYEKFLEMKNKFKISEELLKNLQYEISEEVGIRKVGTSTIIEDFNADDKKI